MHEKREETLTPEEWRERTRKRRKKLEKLLPDETDTYEAEQR
jgi:hypothetical protein